MKKLEILLLVLLLLGAFFVRLYRFDSPIADWHSWRQADTSSVSRNFIKYGFDVLHPRIDNISNVQTNGKYENPNGYFFAEFPLYNIAQAGLFAIFHIFTLEEWGRLVSIFSSLIAMGFIYLITRKYAGKTAGIFAAFFYAFLPFVIYYSRTILPGSSMDAALLGSIYFFDLSLSAVSRVKKMSFFGISVVLGMMAILIRPFALFYILPFLYLAWKKWGIRLYAQWSLYLFAILSILPFILWRLWMLQYPEGIPTSDWLFNGGGIRFTGAFFYWLFAERLSKLLLGYWGVVLLVLGILSKKKAIGLFLSFFASSLFYMTVVAKGNVQHDYYQLAIMPSVVMLLGLGCDTLFHYSAERIQKYLAWVLLVVITLFTLSFGWYNVRDFFNINNPDIVIAGEAVDHLTPKDAKVIALYDGDSSFLYQTNRSGWASFEKSLSELVKLGARYVVIAHPTQNDFNGFGTQYTVVGSSSAYLLLDIVAKP